MHFVPVDTKPDLGALELILPAHAIFASGSHLTSPAFPHPPSIHPGMKNVYVVTVICLEANWVVKLQSGGILPLEIISLSETLFGTKQLFLHQEAQSSSHLRFHFNFPTSIPQFC